MVSSACWLFPYARNAPQPSRDARRMRIKESSFNGLALLAALDGFIDEDGLPDVNTYVNAIGDGHLLSPSS
eukprot:761127-Hanusia_phi.AAC.1